MSTKVYGASDDLIEFDGDVCGEVGCYGTDDDDHDGVLLMFSDGTVLVAKYGKGGAGIWSLRTIAKGKQLQAVTECTDENADPYSDVAVFGDGLKWCYAAKQWERVS